MKYFSQEFGITNSSEIEFLDIDLEEGDNLYFLDPYLISIDKSDFSQKCITKIHNYFGGIIKNAASNSVQEMKSMSKHIIERNETRLGYSTSRKIRGIGFCQRNIMDIFYQVQRKNLETPLIEDTYDCLIFLDNVGHDKISDLITNIVLEDLIEFTQSQCIKHSIPMQQCNLKDPIWDANTMQWKKESVMLPMFKEKPIILVPKHLVGEQQYFSYSRVYKEFVYEDLKSNYAILGFIRLLSKGEKRPDCKKIKQAYPENKSTVASYALAHHNKYLNFKEHLLEDNSIYLVEKEKENKRKKKK